MSKRIEQGYEALESFKRHAENQYPNMSDGQREKVDLVLMAAETNEDFIVLSETPFTQAFNVARIEKRSLSPIFNIDFVSGLRRSIDHFNKSVVIEENKD